MILHLPPKGKGKDPSEKFWIQFSDLGGGHDSFVQYIEAPNADLWSQAKEPLREQVNFCFGLELEEKSGSLDGLDLPVFIEENLIKTEVGIIFPKNRTVYRN